MLCLNYPVLFLKYHMVLFRIATLRRLLENSIALETF